MKPLKPWRQIAVPHEDVHKGTFQQAEFAADITRVHDGTASAEYQDPVLFFQRTFITEGMRLLLDSVARRLAGKGGDPVIQLQTAFGGGKTHTMLAVFHLASGKAAASDLAGIPAILDKVGLIELPRARIAVLDGTKLAPNQPRRVDGQEIRTLWGELAWQLGKADGYALVAESDRSGTSPGKEVLTALIAGASPCVILVDELVAYVRQFDGSRPLAGGTYDSNLSFIQSLTEALKAVPNALMLASLPESEREAGSDRGIAALKAIEHYFGRVQAVWKPVATEEAFEIVRRRLFAQITDRAAADSVCRAFADHYVTHASELPGETQEGQYLERMRAAFPIHPEVFQRLYQDWSALPNFQRTRGVLKLMAKVIHRLWQDGNQDLLILPSSFPIYDATVRSDLTVYLPPGWDPVLDHDVDGERSEPASIEQFEPRFGTVQACRRVSRSVFLGSAPAGMNEMARGVETPRVVLACLQPDQAPHIYRDALGRIEGRLTFLNKGNGRWWFDVRPNLRREMEERKRRFDDDDILAAMREALNRVMGPAPFQAAHLFTPASEISDDFSLRLVVLPPSAIWTRSGPNPGREAALAILKQRGDQPRMRQNRLLFLAADADQVSHLKDLIRSHLAWKSIVADVKDNRITLDNLQQRQAEQQRDQVGESVFRSVRETFRWLISPGQSVVKGGGISEIEWEAFPLNPAAPGLGKEVSRAARENELVIDEWAPTHLNNLLKTWFWKEGAPTASALDVWQKTCAYLYMPRLGGSTVMQSAIAAGAGSRDFFALAFGKDDDKYRGFMFGRIASPMMDELLLIEPGHATAYEAALPASAPRPNVEPQPPDDLGSLKIPADPVPPPGGVGTEPAQSRPVKYFGNLTLDPVRCALQFSTVANEIVQLFTANPKAKVRIKVDIDVEQADGFDEATLRAVRENARTLKFDQSEFE